MKTTKKHFEIFKAECEKWIEIFGLKGWEINFFHKELKGYQNAATEYHITDRYADIYLFPKLKRYKADDDKIRLLAFHEVCEIFMGPMNVNAKERFVARSEINEALHAIIITLQNVLYPKY